MEVGEQCMKKKIQRGVQRNRSHQKINGTPRAEKYNQVEEYWRASKVS